MIYPEIFDGIVMGFFTDREIGLGVEGLTHRRVYFPVQEHTGRVTVLDNSLDPKVADAVVTDSHGVLLGVQVADCVPILLCDRAGRSIAAVHAGWKGTSEGIMKKTIKLMEEDFGARAGDILVAMGPAIRWCCYIVGKDVYDSVARATGEGEYSMMRDDEICLDLQSANKHQALAAGVKWEHISIVEECTFCDPGKYYSYRYSKITGYPGQENAGRQGGFIGFP
jgi:YfiH family protein